MSLKAHRAVSRLYTSTRVRWLPSNTRRVTHFSERRNKPLAESNWIDLMHGGRSCCEIS